MGTEAKRLIKPPIGLRPRSISQLDRLDEVRSAMTRYYEAQLKIPIDWIEEYNDLIDDIKPSLG